MDLHELANGVSRIWASDLIAIVVVGILMAIQVVVLWWVGNRTWQPIRMARREISTLTAAIRHGGKDGANRLRGSWKNRRLSNAWDRSFPERGDALADAPEATERFTSSGLLPPHYNARLDAASPGIFTALGILGTFVGLILGFLRVDPSNADSSIGPLLGGMVVAFLNSLLGVFLSVCWTAGSRVMRHEFEVACEDLHSAASALITRLNPIALLVSEIRRLGDNQVQTNASLTQLDENVVRLQASTETSSAQLLENLSLHLGDSMKALVNAPFDQLTDTVRQFDSIAQRVTQRQEDANRRMGEASETLSQAGKSLTEAVTLTRECVDEFSVASLQMKESAQQVDRIVDTVRVAAVDTMIREIAIEGHTDTVGTFMSNAKLSQDRAYAVLKTMVEASYNIDLAKAQRFRQLVTATGKSEVNPVLTNGTVDAEKSRRIEIHIRFRDDAILKSVLAASRSGQKDK